MEIGGYEVHPAAEVFPMMSGDELEAFVEDVRENGQREPVILIRTDDGNLVLDGRNRLVACERLKLRPEFDWYEGDDPIGYVLSLNLHRRHLNESQRGMVGAKLKPLYEEEAEQRRLANLRQNQPGEAEQAELPDEENLPTRDSGPARDQAAKAVNVSNRQVSKAERVRKDGIPELVEMVETGKIRVDLAEKLAKRPPEKQREVIEKIKAEMAAKPEKNAKAIVRRFDKDKVIESIRREPKPLPEGPFRVIAADWPWLYEKRQDDGTQRGQTPYPTTELTIEDGVKMGARIQEIAYIDCVLWFWTTNAHMPVAHEIVAAWGFTHKTILTWKKTRLGTGDWLRGITEHCIMAVRGNPTVDLTNQTTFFEAPVREHSRKPEEFYALVEGLCPGSKLELFARESRSGWSTWGGEKDQFDSAGLVL